MKKIDSHFESTLAFTSVMSILAGLAVSSKIMTGAATAKSLTLTAFLGIFLLLLGILIGLWYIKKKKSQMKVKIKKSSRKKRK